MDNLITATYAMLCACAWAAPPAWVFARLLPRFRSANMTRAAVMARAAGAALLGLAAPIAMLLLLVGLEEVAGIALVPERIALVAAAMTVFQLATGTITLVALAMMLRGGRRG